MGTRREATPPRKLQNTRCRKCHQYRLYLDSLAPIAAPGVVSISRHWTSSKIESSCRKGPAFPVEGEPLSDGGNYDRRTERKPSEAPMNSRPSNPIKGSELPVFGSRGAGAGVGAASTTGAGAGAGIRTGTSTAIRIG